MKLKQDIKTRRLVVEYQITGKDGERYPTLIIDGSKWGNDFDLLIGDTHHMEYYHDDGESPVDGKPVEYRQLFLVTTMSDEEILAIYQ